MSTIWLVLLATVLQPEADLSGPVPHSGDFYFAQRIHPYLDITGRELFEHPKHQKRGTVTAIKRVPESLFYEASTTKKKQVWLGPTNMPAVKTYCVQLTMAEAAEVARKSPEFRAFEFGFRQAKWGWGKDEVRQSEARPLLSEEEDSLIYHDEVLGLDAFVAYLFVDGQFYLGRYLFAEEHTNLNKYVSDASVVAEALREKYGIETVNLSQWHDRQYLFEPSKLGFAISLGHYSGLSQWETLDTNIAMHLSGDNYKVKLVVEYSSKELAAKANAAAKEKKKSVL